MMEREKERVAIGKGGEKQNYIKKIINNCITYIFPLVPLQNLAQSDRKDDIIVRSSLLITALGSIFTILVVYL